MSQNSTMTITEFLEARLAEDEELASAVLALYAPDNWDNPTSAGNHYPADIAFWDVQSPYRVLAECAAKRAIIAGRKRIDRSANPDEWSMGFSDANYEAITAIAAIYKHHPDYQQEWAPA
jgi:hypothetical protein